MRMRLMHIVYTCEGRGVPQQACSPTVQMCTTNNLTRQVLGRTDMQCKADQRLDLQFMVIVAVVYEEHAGRAGCISSHTLCLLRHSNMPFMRQ